MKKLAIILVLLIAATGCTGTDAETASYNLSQAAEQFEIERRIVFVNGITDENLFLVEGRCSIEDDGNQLEVTCRVGPDEYEKHFLGLSDNVTYFAQQLETADVDEFRTRIIFRPAAIVPDIDVETRDEQQDEAEAQDTE